MKVLIISYFYVPSNYAGSFRSLSFAEELLSQGLEPIVLTRHWSSDDYSSFISDGYEDIASKGKQIRVIRIPFEGQLRDKVYRSGLTFKWILSAVTFLELTGLNFFPKLNPFYEFYSAANKILSNDSSIKNVIISGRPFELFQVGYMLRKRFRYLNWYADYRDPWTSDSVFNTNVLAKILKFIERHFELKYLSNVKKIITVSQGLRLQLKSYMRKEIDILVIHNGFSHFVKPKVRPSSKLRIGYIGSLYFEQRIDVFFDGVMKYLSTFPGSLELIFYGLNSLPDQVKRVHKLGADLDIVISITEKLSKKELYEEAPYCDIFLLIGIPKRSGTITAKFGDYLSFQKPILLISSDDDELSSILKEFQAGFLAKDGDEVEKLLLRFYHQFIQNGGYISPLVGSVGKSEFLNSRQISKLITELKSYEYRSLIK